MKRLVIVSVALFFITNICASGTTALKKRTSIDGIYEKKERISDSLPNIFPENHADLMASKLRNEAVLKFASVIYLHPEGKTTDASVGGRIEQLVKKGYLVAAPDVIGTGETAGSGRVAMLIGRSVVGIQAGEVVRVANFLKSRNDVDPKKMGGMASGEMGPTLLHAAAFDQSINSISLIGSPISYQSLVMNKFYDTGFFNNAVAGALTAYDLPDLIGCLAPRKIALVTLKNQMKQPVSNELIEEKLSFPRAVYSHKKAIKNLHILPSAEDIGSVVAWCFE
jgi:hypothetical protein